MSSYNLLVNLDKLMGGSKVSAAPSGTWRLLGSGEIDNEFGRDVIDLSHNSAPVSAIRLVASKGNVRIKRIRIRYSSGEDFIEDRFVNIGKVEWTQQTDAQAKLRIPSEIVLLIATGKRQNAAVEVLGLEVPDIRSSMVSRADPFPAGKPIEMTIPLGGTGISSDLTAYHLASGMAKVLDVPVPVASRHGPVMSIGSGGWTDSKFVSGLKPDGHSILWVSNFVAPALDKWDYVARVTIEAPVLAVKANSAWRTLKEFMQYAKANPEKVRVGDSGDGSDAHVASLFFFTSARTKITHVHWTSVTDLLAGRVDAVVEFPSTVLPHIKTGNLRPLAVLGTIADPALPDVRTAYEQGYSGFDLWRGIAVPKGTPKVVIGKLEDAIAKTVASAEFKTAGKNFGFIPAFLPSTTFGKIVADDRTRIGVFKGDSDAVRMLFQRFKKDERWLDQSKKVVRDKQLK